MRIPLSVFAIATFGICLRLLIAPSYGYQGLDSDLIEHKQAVHTTLTRGIHQIYLPSWRNDPALSGADWDGGYFTNIPPLIHYLRAATGALYRWLDPRGFEMWGEDLNYMVLEKTDLHRRLANSRGFTVSLKLPGILADFGIALGLYVFLLARAGPRTALAACAAYSMNPGIIFDTAFWGQHDALAAGLVALALALILRGHLEAGFVACALAILSKPQAGAFALLILALGLSRFPLRRVVVASLAAAGATTLVFLPFLMHGTFGLSVVALFRSTVGGEPFLSCNANNLWWLVTGGNGYAHRDDVPLPGGVTARSLGLLALLASNALVIWRLRGAQDRDGSRTFLGASVIGMSFFMFATELHENHMMAVLPLLAFALPADRRLFGVFAVLSVTFLLNMALFDNAVTNPLAAWLGAPVPVRDLSMLVAAVNMATWIALWAIYLRHREREVSSPSAVLVQRGEGRRHWRGPLGGEPPPEPGP